MNRSLKRVLKRRGRTERGVTAVLVVALALSACSGTDDETTATTIEFTLADVPAGAAQTPFCAGMSAISLRVNTDPPDDVNSYLIAEYEALVPVVPDAIASEFQTVLGNLRGQSASTTAPSTVTAGPTNETAPTDPSDGFAEEGYLPDSEPELRLNAYLADKCFGTQSNPGPPPTEPFSEIPAESTTAPN